MTRTEREARNREIIRLYREGVLSNREIGERFGLDGTTVSKIVLDAGVRRQVSTSINGAASRAKALRENHWTRPAGELQTAAVDLVRTGLSYGEVAKLLGVTRNVVAGACDRAGLKVGYRPRVLERVTQESAENARKRWASVSNPNEPYAERLK